MKKIRLIAIVAALICGLAVFQFFRELNKPVEIPHTMAVVAAVNIPANTLVTAEMVTLSPIVTEALLPNALTDPASIIGKVLNGNVYAGEQLIRERLVPDDQTTDLVYKIEKGYRAITLSVSQVSSVSFMIKPTNTVDLILTYTQEVPKEDEADEETEPSPDDLLSQIGGYLPEESTEEEPETKIFTRYLLQNVKVLAVDAVMKETGAVQYSSVTVMVTPEEALWIANVDSQYALRMVLRNALDADIEEVIDVNLDDILSQEEDPEETSAEEGGEE